MDTNTLKFRLSGLGQMLMHCGQTADPLNHFAKAMKKASGKRGKTDEDLAVLANLEWWAGLYTNKPGVIADDFSVSIDPKAHLIIPAHVLDSAIREGARKNKMGKAASAGVIVEGDGLFSHDGDADLNKLALDPAFTARHAVKVGTAKVMRTRPVFSSWHVTFSLVFDPGILDESTIKTALESAGRLVGIGDWRPGAPRGGSFGRFAVEQIK